MVDEMYNRQREWFLSFLRSTTQKKVALGHAIDYLREQGIERVASILEVGTGSGDSLIPLMRKLKESESIPVRCTVCEPNAGVLLLFLLNYLDAGLPLDALRVKELKDVKDTYGLVISSHAFYYINNWKGLSADIYQKIGGQGAAFITLTSANGALYRLREEFFPLVRHKELGETKPHSGDDLCRVLGELGIRYHRTKLESLTDVTDCLAENQAGKNLLSFFLRTPYETLPRELQNRLLMHVTDNSYPENGRHYLRFEDDAVWIRKNGRKKEEETLRYVHNDLKLCDAAKLLYTPLNDVLGADLADVPEETKKAYLYTLLVNHFFSHPQFRVLAYSEYNDPRFIFTSVDENGQKMPDPKNMDNIRVCSCIHENKYEINQFEKDLARGRTEKIASDFLKDFIGAGYACFKAEQKTLFGSAEGFQQWVTDTYRSLGHAKIFSPDNEGLLARL